MWVIFDALCACGKRAEAEKTGAGALFGRFARVVVAGSSTFSVELELSWLHSGGESAAQSETRNPKSETNPNVPKPKARNALRTRPWRVGAGHPHRHYRRAGQRSRRRPFALELPAPHGERPGDGVGRLAPWGADGQGECRSGFGPSDFGFVAKAYSIDSVEEARGWTRLRGHSG